MNANLAQVEGGMAWVYRRYARDGALFGAEASAKNDRRGLWADAEATPPWEFRRTRK